MKRSGAFALTILYTVTVMGFAFNLHYCFNRLTSVNINAAVKTCGMQVNSKMKCCKDKHIEIKVKDVHHVESASFLTKVPGLEVPKLPFLNAFFSVRRGIADNFSNNDPPDIPAQPHVTFLKNRVFRI